MPEARIHHYVPQFYLRRFCQAGKKPTLFVVDGEAKVGFRTSPKKVGAERDFNRIEVEGQPPDILERGLSAFEGEVADAVGRICERRSFADSDDRSYVLNLLTLMALRNPRQRKNLSEFHGRVAKAIMGVVLATPERWGSQVAAAKASGHMKADAVADYEMMRDFVERDEYDVIVRNEHHIALELSTFEKLLPYLFDRKWTLLRARPDTGGFITSDHPVCLMWSEQRMRDGFYPPGFGLKGTHVIFPLTPDLALVGRYEGEDAEYDVDIVTVARMNAVIIGFAERQVYARDDGFPYLRRGPAPLAWGNELVNDGTFIRPRQQELEN